MTGRGCDCGTCVTCKQRTYTQRYREKNREKILEKDRELKRYKRRIDPDHERALRRAYYQRHAERIAENNLENRSKERHKAVARTMVSRAVASGTLTKGKCEVGGDCFGAIEAHHDDYSKPLEVRWICKSHHMQIHASEKE